MASATATSGSGSDGGGASGQDRSSSSYHHQQHHHHNAKITFDIKTKSVEQTLVPLVHQITTLVNAKEKPLRSERALNALVRVGQAVNMAVDRFVRVGEAIALENPEIQQEMCVACHEAKIAGCKIEKLTDVKIEEQTTDETARSIAEKTAMVRAARQLLSAISRVLILADKVVIKQLITTKDKVSATLKKIECCTNFAEFVQIFSQFGNEMVQLAHASGGRQNDLKSERSRAQVGVARSVLEKSTMLLLTAAKTYLRHHDNQLAKQNRDTVVKQMNFALDLIHHVVTDGESGGSSGGGSGGGSGSGSFGGFLIQPVAAFKAIKELEDQAETVRVTLVNSTIEQSLLAACDIVMETIQDFTDSAYTNHEDRELILMLCERLRHEIVVLLRSGFSMDQPSHPMATQMKSLDTAILKTKEACRALKKQLVNTTMDHASNLFRLNEDEVLINDMRMASTQGNMQLVDEVIQQFESHAEQLREVCKLLRHVSSTESLLIWSAHMENTIKSHAPQMMHACRLVTMYPTSKMAVENFQVFSETWVNHVNDLSILVKDVSDVCLGKTDKQVYLSLPKPGKHGANTRGLKPINLNNEEQAKIAKAGLEVKLITSELDAEADRWVEPENEIVRRAKNMSCMAFSIYLFTRGEGPLKNTRDLFVQAGYFAEEGTKLYKTAREFSKQVPQSSHKTELMCMLDSVPSYCQHLNFTVRSQTVGKAATFNKVDQIIQNTKDLMNAIAKLVTSCYVCATKYNIAYRGQLVGPWNTSSSSPPSSSSGNDSNNNKHNINSNNNNNNLTSTTSTSGGGSMNRGDWSSSNKYDANMMGGGTTFYGNVEYDISDVDDFRLQHKYRQQRQQLSQQQQQRQQSQQQLYAFNNNSSSNINNNNNNFIQQHFVNRVSNGSGGAGALDDDTFRRSLSLTNRSNASSVSSGSNVTSSNGNNGNINNYDKL